MDTFGANDTNKIATQNLYWQWKLETGSTQAEIDANDLLDSKWMGDSITLGIEASGKQVMEDTTTQYNVTFDLNGGTLANHGDSTQITKQVTYGGTYGDLPTPTREGYTFAGWNGKNIINKSKASRIEIQNETPFTSWAGDGPIFDNMWVKNNLEPNKQYTISYDIECISIPEYDSTHSDNLGLYLYDNGGIWLMKSYFIKAGEKIHYEKNFTTPSDIVSPERRYRFLCYTNRYVKNGEGVNSTIILSNLQLEEGSTSTPYEPYYVTDTTTVTQTQNHTLTAIWEPKSN